MVNGTTMLDFANNIKSVFFLRILLNKVGIFSFPEFDHTWRCKILPSTNITSRYGENGNLSLRLQSTRPEGANVFPELHLYLHPSCSYQVVITKDRMGAFGRVSLSSSSSGCSKTCHIMFTSGSVQGWQYWFGDTIMDAWGLHMRFVHG